MIRIGIALYFLMFCNFVSGQQTISGKVIDLETRQPLAFANIVFGKSTSEQVISDINGNFSFNTHAENVVLKCSYVGYRSLSIAAVNDKSKITIELRPQADELLEVVINPNENPANRIIRKTIANRKINNPENLKSFRYRCYNKVVFDFLRRGADEATPAFIAALKNSHILLMESTTERKYLKPNLSEEVVTATKVSGFQNPTFASLATDLQPFSFYQDYIKLFDIHYLNPISEGSLKKYKFRLEDEIYKENDTIFIVSYEPKAAKNFDGLKGVLYINSNKYAIQNVIATPFEKAKVDIKIQQQYQFVDNAWFPEQLNYMMTVKDYPAPDVGLYAEGKSYVSSVEINRPISKKDFAPESVRLAEDATEKDSVFWNQQRYEKLTRRDLQTYKTIDSIGKVEHFDRYLTFAEKVLQGKIPLKYVDLDLSKTFVYNKFEGYRGGLGFLTNDAISKNITVGGFFGYGFKDRQWKYGYEANYRISRKNEFTVGIKHQDNLREIGNSGIRNFTNSIYDFRSILAYRFDRIRQNELNVSFRNFRYAQWKILLQQENIIPKYDYEFEDGSRIFTNYKNTTASVYLRYAYGEKRISSFGNTFIGGTDFPIVSFFYSHGFKNLFDGDFNFDKIEVAADQAFFTKNFGGTVYRIEGGIATKSIPAGLLFTGEGSYDKDFPFVIKNTFQTMEPYEFLSDRYANLFLSHDFGTLLFKAGRFQPNIIVANNFGWGDLQQPEQHDYLSFMRKNKVYCETGLKLDNLIKFNYMNLGYFGLGSAVFYRYGQYAKPGLKDNLAIKMTLNFSIK